MGAIRGMKPPTEKVLLLSSEGIGYDLLLHHEVVNL